MQKNQLFWEMRKKGVLVAAHRGSAAGNIPFNTAPAFEAALFQGADIIETDLTLCADGELFVFHPGQERNHLNRDIRLEHMTAEEIRKERYVNFDSALTDCPLLTLDELLEQLKGRCLINIDHAWDYLPQTVDRIRRHGMAEQIILKTPAKENYLQIMETVAPDIMYIPIVKETDTISQMIESKNINFAGVEAVFTKDTSPVAQPEYIRQQHEKGRFVWVNAILYYYKSLLSGTHTDDVAVAGNPDHGWGWLAERGFDIIQTDWVYQLRQYLNARNY